MAARPPDTLRPKISKERFSMKKITNNFRSRVVALSVAVAMCLSMFSATASAATQVEAKLTCTLQAHTHGEKCYSVVPGELICGVEEVTPHTHGEDCYTYETTLTCGQEASEGHTHGDGCYTTVENTSTELVCTSTEEGHEHSESCYATTTTTETQLTCTLPESTGHQHTPQCNATVKTLVCTMAETPGHVHTEVCYGPETKKLTCTASEHVHDASCYTSEGLSDRLNSALSGQGHEDNKKVDGDENLVILVLNGVTIIGTATGTTTDTESFITVTNGKVLHIQEGSVSGGKIMVEDDSGEIRPILIAGGGKVIIDDNVTITGGNADNGGGVLVGGNSTLIMNDGTITGNTAQNGGGVMVNPNGTFEMNGGTISSNTAITGGGVTVKGDATMNGGVIAGNTAVGTDGTYSDKNAGGGVYVTGNGGKFTLNGAGIIGKNEAGEGGGIFVENKWTDGKNDKDQFEMNGGLVIENKAHTGEGGGIYIRGDGVITGGLILGNSTETTKDLGGGGIYVESDGTLTIKNAVITENIANGLGGGLSACVHGNTIIYSKDGAAIFGNDAKGDKDGYVKNPVVEGEDSKRNDFIDGSQVWKDNQEFKDGAEDVFIASDANEKKPDTNKNPGVIIGNGMLGGGLADWTGNQIWYDGNQQGYKFNEDGTIKTNSSKIDGSNNATISNVDKDGNVSEKGQLIGITANAKEEAKENAWNTILQGLTGMNYAGWSALKDLSWATLANIASGIQGVIISGNVSANTHGGGVANNGVLIIGEDGENKNTNTHPTIDVTKYFEGGVLTGGDFEFEMKDAQNQEVPVTVKKNDGEGKVSFDLPENYFTKSSTDSALEKRAVP